MKKLFFVLFIAVSLNCSAQDWVKHQFDENLTVEMPANFEVLDTLDQHLVRVIMDNGIIVVQRKSNSGMSASSIRSKQELIKSYEEFGKGYSNSHRSQVLKQMNHDVNGIVTSEFTLRTHAGGEQSLIHVTLVFLNDNWYIIQFWEPEPEGLEDVNEAVVEKLFSSIEFPADAVEENQFSDSGSRGYKMGYAFGRVIGFLLIALVFGLIMYVIFGRRKKIV